MYSPSFPLNPVVSIVFIVADPPACFNPRRKKQTAAPGLRTGSGAKKASFRQKRKNAETNQTHSVRKELSGKITVARIGQQCHDIFPGIFRALGQLDRSSQCGAGRNADQDALAVRELAPIAERVAFDTAITSSYTLVSNVSGTKPAPIP